jgi:metacaspase-1
MSELQQYKKQEIAKINAEYNRQLSQLRRNYNQNVVRIQKSRLDYNRKRRTLNNLRIQFNRNITNLNKRRTSRIRSINTIKVLPQTQPQTSTTTTSNKYALLIGINYTNTPHELYGCINDVMNIRTLLEQTYNYKNIVLLTDNTDKKPFKINILDEFTNLLRNANAGDELFFSYSGHGSYTMDRDGDEIDGQDETIVPLDNQHITDDELRQLIISNLKPDVKLFAMFDSCHSGTMLDLRYNYFDSDNFNKLTINNNINETSGMVTMISGCMDNQTSTDALFVEGNKRQYQGAMTWAFLNTLKQQPSNITLKSLLEQMRNILKQSNFSQIPQLSCGKSIDINTAKFAI